MIISKKLLRYKEINHGFFNKLGGKSIGIYKSLNCGPGSRDKKNKIAENLKIVKNKIKKYQLEEYIKIFNYLDDLELISLYLKCFGVIMPSFVGHTTIPMYEAFYFEKNIFYTKGLSDNKLQSFLTEIDISDINSFKDRYYEIIKNKIENDKKLKDAKKFYEEYCNSKNTAENFKKVFEEYKFYKKTWS